MVDRALGAERAVKLVRPDRIHDPTNFYAEPQTLVELKHPNIVEVHDAGTLPDGRIYIAMEFLKAGSVEDRYQGAIVPVADALTIVADACRGIEYAHSKGYIHRDVKPANLLLSNATTKVSDFGLATRTTGAGVASPYGYVSHCAPEVIDPGEATVRSDVYALGMTLYRLLNGDSLLPDPAELGMPIDEAILAGTFPHRSVFRDHIPRTARLVVKKAIAYDPDDRTQTAAALRHDIEAILARMSLTLADKDPLEVTVEDLRDVIDLWADREARTRAKVTSVVRAFWTWAEEQDQVPFSPAAKLRRPRAARRAAPLLPASADARLLNAAQTPRDRVGLLFLLDLGCAKASSRASTRAIST